MTPHQIKLVQKAVLQLVRAVEGRSHLRSLMPSTELKPQMEGGGQKQSGVEPLFQDSSRSLRNTGWFSASAQQCRVVDQEVEAGRVQEHICHQDKRGTQGWGEAGTASKSGQLVAELISKKYQL